MDRPVSEHELLSLIEGRLPAERAEAVRAAIDGDPALREAVNAMTRDRALSRELTLSAERAAPAAMAGAALAAAERLALLAGAPRARGWRARVGARRYALATLLLFFGATVTLVGAGVYWLTRPSDPDVIYTRGLGATGRFEPAPDRRNDAGALPWPGGAANLPAMGSDVFMAPADTTASTAPPGQPAQEPPAITSDDPSQWAQEVERKLGEAADHSFEDSVEFGGMTLGRAVRLARAGRLRMVVPVEDPAHWPRGRALLASGSVRRDAPTEADRDAPGGPEPLRFSIELAIPWDERGMGLKDAVSGLYSRLSAMASGDVRLEEIPDESGEGDLGGALPSAEPTDVLWWANPASKWTRAESFLVGVRLEAAK